MGAKLIRGGLVVDNFMCQLYRVMGCLDIWPDIILGTSVKVFFG